MKIMVFVQSSLVTNGTWSPLVTSKSFNCSPHASHSGLQWLLGVTCGDQFPLVTCEDYTNETLSSQSRMEPFEEQSHCFSVLVSSSLFRPMKMASIKARDKHPRKMKPKTFCQLIFRFRLLLVCDGVSLSIGYIFPRGLKREM